MSTQLKPLYDRVLVKRIESEDKTKGGLFIPDSAKEKPLEGEVVAVGAGKMLDNGSLRPVSLKARDPLFFSKISQNTN